MTIYGHYETETQDFKKALSELDKGIMSLTAMLNKGGKGKVYFGVSDDGEVVGLKGSLGKKTIRKIEMRIVETVKPTIVPKIYFEAYGKEMIIAVEAEGYNKPYSASGEYRIRVGRENKKIEPEMLDELFISNAAAMATNTQANYDGLPKSHAAVLKIIRESPLSKTDQIAKAAGLSRTRIGQIIADLKEMGKLVRKGGKRDGFWKTR